MVKTSKNSCWWSHLSCCIFETSDNQLWKNKLVTHRTKIEVCICTWRLFRHLKCGKLQSWGFCWKAQKKTNVMFFHWQLLNINWTKAKILPVKNFFWSKSKSQKKKGNVDFDCHLWLGNQSGAKQSLVENGNLKCGKPQPWDHLCFSQRLCHKTTICPIFLFYFIAKQNNKHVFLCVAYCLMLWWQKQNYCLPTLFWSSKKKENIRFFVAKFDMETIRMFNKLRETETKTKQKKNNPVFFGLVYIPTTINWTKKQNKARTSCANFLFEEKNKQFW